VSTVLAKGRSPQIGPPLTIVPQAFDTTFDGIELLGKPNDRTIPQIPKKVAMCNSTMWDPFRASPSSHPGKAGGLLFLRPADSGTDEVEGIQPYATMDRFSLHQQALRIWGNPPSRRCAKTATVPGRHRLHGVFAGDDKSTTNCRRQVVLTRSSGRRMNHGSIESSRGCILHF